MTRAARVARLVDFLRDDDPRTVVNLIIGFAQPSHGAPATDLELGEYVRDIVTALAEVPR